MNVIFLQNTVYGGKRYVCGEAVELEKAVAERFVKANLAHPSENAVKNADNTLETPEGGTNTENAEKPVEQPKEAKKTANKAKGKAAKKK